MSATAWLRRNIVFPLWIAKDRSPRLRYLRELERSQFLPVEQLRELQFKKMRAMIEHAYRETPYYKQLFDNIGLNPQDINSFEDFKKIPILSKDDIRHNRAEMLASSLKHGYLSEFKTGGSTGVPVVVLKDAHSVELVNATAARVFRWAGWNMGDAVGMIWGNSPASFTTKEKLKNLLISPEIYLDTMNLTDTTMNDFVQLWQRTQPSLLRGHSHSIFIFASFCKNHGIASVRPKAIISSSMMLIPSERRVIEEAFACKVTDLYGCEEVGLIACECEQHHGMHVDMENNFVEILDPAGNDTKPGEDGALVITNLINRAMPLLRYKIGDVTSFSTRTCACGRSLPLINSVSGRVADFFVRKDGSVVAGVSLVERTLTKFPGIAQMQMIQENLEKLVVKLVRDPSYDDNTHRELLAELKFSVGADEVRIEFVDKIPQETSGKYRFAISKITNPFS